MREYELKKMWIRRALDSAALTSTDRSAVAEFLASLDGMHSVHVELNKFPGAFWRAILREAQLPATTRTGIALHVFGIRQSDCNLDSIYEMEVADPVEFGVSLQLSGSRSPNCEMQLNGRWYPVVATIRFIEDGDKVTRGVELRCAVQLGDRAFGVGHMVSRDLFLDEASEKRTVKVIEVLERLGYQRLMMTAAEFNLRLVSAERMAASFGKVVLVTGSVIAPSRFSWWKGFETQSLGSPEMPSRCVVEPALEVDHDHRYMFSRDDESESRLPFVRIFCLETKSYVYADIDDITEYHFDTEALTRLQLPADMHSILRRVFSTPIENMFGDLLQGKHGGAVVLASGEPGVGKTLTAEIYAEITERPLYVLELGELGTRASEVEENLQCVFARVTRWNAVLQFDECEIFLAQRGNDLERSAIVGIFLRLLDYYRGLLFLTTNRPEVLDDAVLSRVMLRLQYPRLDAHTRAMIWKTMFEVAGLHLQECSFEKLGGVDLNGRQIRNLTRLARILFPDGFVNKAGIRDVLRFGCGSSLDGHKDSHNETPNGN
ncbi:MAG: AAA family ATPase [Planctomycetaceae bacterium]|nr:AAA family ATPase [Planctomycetaceae bacterium]